MTLAPEAGRSFTSEQKQRIVEKVRCGRSPDVLSLEFGPTVASIRQWVAQAQRRRSAKAVEISLK